MDLRRALPIVLLVVNPACSNDSATSARSSEAGTLASDGGSPGREASSGLVPSLLPPNFHCDPTLESIKSTIFETSCAFDSCHGDNNFAYGLWLSADLDTVSKELVGAPSKSCKPWMLVAPGDPDRSFLLDKLSSDKPACGVRMPNGIEPLPESALSCVRTWIQNL